MGIVEERKKGANIVLDDLTEKVTALLQQKRYDYSQHHSTAIEIQMRDLEEFITLIQRTRNYVSTLSDDGQSITIPPNISETVTVPPNCPFTEEELDIIGNRELKKRFSNRRNYVRWAKNSYPPYLY